MGTIERAAEKVCSVVEDFCVSDSRAQSQASQWVDHAVSWSERKNTAEDVKAGAEKVTAAVEKIVSFFKDMVVEIQAIRNKVLYSKICVNGCLWLGLDYPAFVFF